MTIPEELKGVIQSDPQIMSGALCFVGTRVPVKNLMDSISAGEPLEYFLNNYSRVTLEQALAVLHWQNAVAQKLIEQAS